VKPPSVWPYVLVGALAICVIVVATSFVVLAAISDRRSARAGILATSFAGVFVYQLAYKLYADRCSRYEASVRHRER
jgi:hypothetical protein